MCYYNKYVLKGENDMRLLRLAVESQRWDLAAHTIILATAQVLQQGERPYGKTKEKKRRPTRQSKS
jgi:hypothetical protein